MSDDNDSVQDEAQGDRPDDAFAADSEQLEDLFENTEPDRNRNLSSVIDDIQDYGSESGPEPTPAAEQAPINTGGSDEASWADPDSTEDTDGESATVSWDDSETAQPASVISGGSRTASLLMIFMPAVLLTALGASVWWMNGRIAHLEEQPQQVVLPPVDAATAVLAEQLGELEARILAIESKSSFRDANTDLRLGKLEQLEDTVGAELRQLRRELMAVNESSKRQPGDTTTAAVAAAAADTKALGAASSGDEVPVPAPRDSASQGWFVNVGTFSQLPTAQALATRLQVSDGAVEIVTGDISGRTLYRVRVAGFSTRVQADRARYELQREYEMEELWIGRKE